MAIMIDAEGRRTYRRPSAPRSSARPRPNISTDSADYSWERNTGGGVLNPYEYIPTPANDQTIIDAALGQGAYSSYGPQSSPNLNIPTSTTSRGGGRGWGGGGGGGGGGVNNQANFDAFWGKVLAAMGGMQAPQAIDPRYSKKDVNKAENADVRSARQAWNNIPAWTANPFKGADTTPIHLDANMADLIAAQGGDSGAYQGDVDLGNAQLAQAGDNWGQYNRAMARNARQEQNAYKADTKLGKAESVSNINAQRAALLTAAGAEAARAKEESARLQAEHQNNLVAMLIQMLQSGLSMGVDVSKLGFNGIGGLQ